MLRLLEKNRRDKKRGTSDLLGLYSLASVMFWLVTGMIDRKTRTAVRSKQMAEEYGCVVVDEVHGGRYQIGQGLECRM